MVGQKTVGAATVGVLLAGLGAAQLMPSGSSPLSSSPARAGELIAYDSCGPLLKAYRDELARTATPYGWGNQGGAIAYDMAVPAGGGTTGASGIIAPGEARAAVPAPQAAGAAEATSNGATGTNVQEKGVDEPDIVKLADGHLVTVSGGALRVISTGDVPTVIGRLALPGQGEQSRGYGGTSQELLVDGDRALVIDQGHRVTGKAPVPSGSSGTGTSTGPADVGPATPVAPDEPVSDKPGVSSSSTTTGPSQVDPVAPMVPPVPADTPPDAGGSNGAEATVGTSTGTSTGVAAGDAPLPVDALPMPMPYPGTYDLTTPTTVLRLADLSDPAHPRWIETYQLDGSYLSARLVDGTVRLVTRSQPSPTPVAPLQGRPTDQQSSELQQQKMLAANKAAAQTLTLAQVLPRATRTDGAGTQLEQGAAVRCADVSHAVDAAGGGLLLVTTLHPADGLDPVDSTGVQADGDLVYATADRLFVATSRWGTSSSGFAREASASGDVTTQVHAFDTSKGDDLRYLGTGSVKGYVYGRWALSWHEGSLRIATTTGQPWGGAARTSSSSVVVLDSDLKEVGRVDELGKGEMIQAVRYLGNYATVVTFRQTDPLYVLDLSDPAAPRLTGELKLPGFSTYLHPIGGSKLLGIGMENEGLQASVFDLSDLTKPTQVDRLQLGQGYSEALQESRAFGYDPVHRLAVLPFQDFRGASSGLGITIAADGHLSRAGTIAVDQASGQQCPVKRAVVDAGTSCGYVGGQVVRRVVLDGDRVHVVTDSSVVTGTATGLHRTGSVTY